MHKLKKGLVSFFREYALLMRSVHPFITAMFFISIIGMNLLANKSINTGLDWLALDCGILLSWMCFMAMDITTKRYGLKAANILSVTALLVNLLLALIFFIASIIPGEWSQSYVPGSEEILNNAFNETFKGTWYIIVGSSVAFIVSAIVNNVFNWGIGKMFKKNPDGFVAFACRTYVSTAIGQFIDNILFAIIVSRVFFGWTWVQCVTCAATGMLAELLFEIVFSPFGYRFCKYLDKYKVGEEYLAYQRQKQEAKS